MTTRAALVSVVGDVIRDPQADSTALRIVGLGLSAGLILVCAGLWLARKVGV